jgi:hypothetical protein
MVQGEALGTQEGGGSVEWRTPTGKLGGRLYDGKPLGGGYYHMGPRSTSMKPSSV